MKRLLFKTIASLILCWTGLSLAQPAAADVEHWLMRLQDATRQRAYVGTFVVNAGNQMTSSRIWHVCDGDQQIERVDTLTGVRRSTFRRNDQVVTFLPDSHTVIQETRESLGMFPNLLHRADASVASYYRLSSAGQARVAGLQTDVVQLVPLDKLRFGYRIWTERLSGLVVKVQTLDAANKVLEQAAFSELQLNAPVDFNRLKALMDNTQGFQVHRPTFVKTTLDQEGWAVGDRVPGFVPVRCYKRPEVTAESMQCIFSDGLASVSLFVAPFDPKRHVAIAAHAQLGMGATHMQVRQLDAWWLTAVGEVPPQTLLAFLQTLERKK